MNPRAFRLATFIVSLGWCTTAAHAQRLPPPSPAPSQETPAPPEEPAPKHRTKVAPPAKEREEPNAPSPSPSEAPQANEAPQASEAPSAVEAPPSDAPPPSSPVAEQAPPPAPPPAQSYEGQVGVNGSTPAYEEDINKGDRADQPKAEGSDIPGFSIRIDPFNWLLEGRLGLELEVVAYKFVSVELVPVFVANTKPPSFNFSGRDDPLSQHSHGLGPIAGTSIDAGFWLSGKPLEGYVLRAFFTNYAFTYKASDSKGVFDRVNHTERHLGFIFGSHMRLGFFTLAGGIGLGYELNQQQRCFVNTGTSNVMAASSGCPNSHEMQIELDRGGSEVADLNGGFHPFYVIGRFSLGVAFD